MIRSIASAGLLMLLLPVVTRGMQDAKLLAPDPAKDDNFGTSVAVQGDEAFVGAARKDGERGAVYVFAHDGSAWIETQKLVPTDSDFDQFFGSALAVEGNRLLIGARGDDEGADRAGAAYVFERSGAGWVQAAKLRLDQPAIGDALGGSVGLSGNRAVIGSSDAAHVFVRSDRTSTWSMEQTLLPPDTSIDGQFGSDVDIDGDHVVIGAFAEPSDVTRSGAAYVFRRRGTNWRFEQKLLASDPDEDDRFGTRVCLLGNTIAVGAPHLSDHGFHSGAVYLFERSSRTWTETQRVVASNAYATGLFGTSIDLDGDRLVVGAVGAREGTVAAGSCYVFDRLEGTWLERARISPADGRPNHGFGIVGLAGDRLIVGAPKDSRRAPDAGSAYLFDLSGAIALTGQRDPRKLTK